MINLLKKVTAMAALAVVFCCLGQSVQAAPQKIAVSIDSEYDLNAYPLPGTFTMTVDGEIVASGTVMMEVRANKNGTSFHCLYEFMSTSGAMGTLIIREQCVLALDPDIGRWEIVSGTGDFEGVKGNGSALMPGNQEHWVGFLY